MSLEYQHSILWRGEDPTKAKFTPGFDASKKVSRLRAGQVPEWAKNAEEEDEDAAAFKRPKRKPQAAPRQLAVGQDAAANRLKRLVASASSADGQERMLRHRVIQDARVLEADKEDKAKDEDQDDKGKIKLEAKDEAALLELDGGSAAGVAEVKLESKEEDDDEIRELKRERARHLALLKRHDEEAALLAQADDEDDLADDLDDDDDNSEAESESDDDPRRCMLVKPVFKPRSQRETLKEREALEKEEEDAEERRKERLKDKKVESKGLLVEQIKLAEEADKAADMNDSSDIELVDDNDEINEAEEYDLWKIRELKRIKRDKEERLERRNEIEFIMKRRGMTDVEREEDDRRMDLKSNKKDEAKQFNFLQKYYHRGGFFQDKAVKGEEPLYLRDYHEPLEEEKFDKTLLPKAMQLRRGQFGKKGQVKHSHLTEVDTTDRSAAWAQHTKQVQRYQERMATASGVGAFDRPSSKAT